MDGEHLREGSKKGPGGSDDLVCYCFGYTRGDIEQDYRRHGRSAIMDTIVGLKRQGRCDCAVRNPKGR